MARDSQLPSQNIWIFPSCNWVDLSSMETSTKSFAESECLQPGFNRYFKTNRPFHSSQKVTKLLHETEAKVDLAQLEKWK